MDRDSTNATSRSEATTSDNIPTLKPWDGEPLTLIRDRTNATEERMEHDPTVRHCICKVCEAWRGRIRRLRDRWLKTAQGAGFEAYRNFAGDMESELLYD